MKYMLILTNNKCKVKTLYSTSSYEKAINMFKKMLSENNIDLPKKHLNYNGIKKLESEILLVKERSSTDKNRIITDKLGRFVEEKSDDDTITILDSAIYYTEETFYVFGHDYVNDRYTVRDIIKKILMNGIKSKTDTKQILILNNKLIIRDNDEIDIVICKCYEDCLRLYSKLKEIVLNSKINRLIFMGNVAKNMKREIYTLIKKKTGWNDTKMWRTNTRP